MTTVDGKHFGTRLREARLQAGFSQSELEDLSGIPKARLSRYENGHVEPSIQTLARLARALNVSEASLLGDQRATLEGFFDVLSSRGVRIESAEQGRSSGQCGCRYGQRARRHGLVRRRGRRHPGRRGPGRVGPGRDVGRSRHRTPPPTSPDVPPAAALERLSPHERGHRRRDARRPRGPSRRSRIVRRVLSGVVGSRRALSPAGQHLSLHRRLAPRDALPSAAVGLLVRGRRGDVRRAGGPP